MKSHWSVTLFCLIQTLLSILLINKMAELVFVLKQQLICLTERVATSFIGIKFNALVYTPWAIKTCHFVFDYRLTLVFLGWFLYFLHQWKDEGILYTGVNKIYHFTLTVSPHYLVKLKRHINSTFWSQSSQYVRSNRLLATCEEISPMLFFANS